MLDSKEMVKGFTDSELLSLIDLFQCDDCISELVDRALFDYEIDKFMEDNYYE